MSDPLSAWPAFSDAVRARLEAGRTAYRDRSFSRPPAELADEIEMEILDLCGWAFILHERLRALRNQIAAEQVGRMARQELDATLLRSTRYERGGEDSE